jgi:hypothetical protein
MSDVTAYSLFPTNVYKTRIDPSSYDKDTLVDKMMANYELEPQRNNWDAVSILHHTYNDANNSKFQAISVEELKPLYNEIVNKTVRGLSLLKPLNFKFNIANIAINTKYMQLHDHGSPDPNLECAFSCIHYIKYKKDMHPNTTLVNPFQLTPDRGSFDKYRSAINHKDITNSVFSSEWEIDVEEDDMIIFPAYLEHYVRAKTNADFTYPRLIVALNIDVI